MMPIAGTSMTLWSTEIRFLSAQQVENILIQILIAALLHLYHLDKAANNYQVVLI